MCIWRPSTVHTTGCLRRNSSCETPGCTQLFLLLLWCPDEVQAAEPSVYTRPHCLHDFLNLTMLFRLNENIQSQLISTHMMDASWNLRGARRVQQEVSDERIERDCCLSPVMLRKEHVCIHLSPPRKQFLGKSLFQLGHYSHT